MESPIEHDMLAEALADAAQSSRRKWLRIGLISLGIATIGGASALALTLRANAREREESRLRAEESEAAILAGRLPDALKLADAARALDPENPSAALAWTHARAVDLIDGNGTPADAVGLLHQARLFGVGDVDFAIASLACAIGMRNEKLTRALLKQHEDQAIAGSALYAFVRGAGLDLTCNLGASVLAYEQAIGEPREWSFARVRHARALVVSKHFDEARASIAKLAPASLEARVLNATLAALSGPPTSAEPLVLADLPRSLRPLSAACSLVDPSSAAGQSMGLDAALDDLDSALVAVACASVALKKGDRAAAKAASERALAMQPDLEETARLGAKLALDEGDLATAKKVAGDGAFDVSWVSAYESEDSVRLGELVAAAGVAEPNLETARIARDLLALRTSLASKDAADEVTSDLRATLTKRAEKATTDALVWASLLAFDLAMLPPESKEAAKKIASAWSTDRPPEAIRKRKAKLTP